MMTRMSHSCKLHASALLASCIVKPPAQRTSYALTNGHHLINIRNNCTALKNTIVDQGLQGDHRAKLRDCAQPCKTCQLQTILLQKHLPNRQHSHNSLLDKSRVSSETITGIGRLKRDCLNESVPLDENFKVSCFRCLLISHWNT